MWAFYKEALEVKLVLYHQYSLIVNNFVLNDKKKHKQYYVGLDCLNLPDLTTFVNTFPFLLTT